MTVLDAIAQAEQLTLYRRAERRHRLHEQEHREQNRPLMARLEHQAAVLVKRAIVIEKRNPAP